jgi:hypothetical protein
MATPRKRSPSGQTSGFGIESIEETSNVSEKDERENLEEFQEVTTNGVFEMIELAEEKVETAPFFEDCIVPTEDLGLRFVETPELTAKAAPTAAPLKAPPKRHPRNTPKFSRTAK